MLFTAPLVLTTLATMAYAAAVPSTAAASVALPAKFHLTWTATSGGRNPFAGITKTVTYSDYFPSDLVVVSNPLRSSNQVDAILYTNATTGNQYVFAEERLSATGTLSFSEKYGFMANYFHDVDAPTQFSQIGGLLALDAADGKGPTATGWTLCGFTDNSLPLDITWNKVRSFDPTWPYECTPINLNVLAL